MVNFFGMKADIMAIGFTAMHVITAPKMFISSLLAGIVLGTVISVKLRPYNAKNLSLEPLEDPKAPTSNAIINQSHNANFEILSSRMLDMVVVGINGYLYYAHLINRSVSPIFTLFGSLFTFGLGIKQGIPLGHSVSKQIMHFFDQRPLAKIRD